MGRCIAKKKARGYSRPPCKPCGPPVGGVVGLGGRMVVRRERSMGNRRYIGRVLLRTKVRSQDTNEPRGISFFSAPGFPIPSHAVSRDRGSSATAVS